MKNKILITGANGHLGSRCWTFLRGQGHEILGTDRMTSPTASVALDFSQTSDELTKLLETFQPNKILHAAGIIQGSANELKLNLRLAENLGKAMVDAQSRAHLLALGSAAEYGDPKQDFVDEDFNCDPISDYGRAKFEETQIHLRLSREGNYPFTLARLFNLFYIPEIKSMPVADWISQIASQKCPATELIIRVQNVDIIRDFLPVETAARGLCRLLAEDEGHGIVNLASGIPVRLRPILETISEIAKRPMKLIENPSARNSIPRVVANTDKLQRILKQKLDFDLGNELRNCLREAGCL